MKDHNCAACGRALLIKVLEAVVPNLCPTCRPVYALAKDISKTEAMPSNVAGVASAVCGILLLFAGAKIIDDLFFS